MANAVEHQAALLLRCLGLHEPHVRPGHRFADCLGVGGIVLLPLDVWLHVGRRHQPHGVTERLKLARPMMRGRAGLNPDETRRKLLKERNNIPAPELTANDHVPPRVDAVDLKDRLRNIETNRRDRVHVQLPQILAAPSATTSMALTCQWRSRPQHQKRTLSATSPPASAG